MLVLVGGLVVVTPGLFGPAAYAQPDQDAAAQAAREIAEAQQRANDAAEAWALAEGDLEALEGEAADLEVELAGLRAEVDALRSTVEAAAVERYMSSGSTGMPLLAGYQAPLDQLQADELSRAASGSADDAFDTYDLARDELEAKAAELADKQEELDEQRKTFISLHEQALAEVAHLQEVEARRLEDERVRLALEAQRREEQRRLAEQQAAEAAQRAAEEAQRAAAQQAAADLENSRRAAAAAQDAARNTPSSGNGPFPAAPAPVGDGSAPAVEQPAFAPADPGMVCPVAGATAYGDTYGAPRSGGRRHEGVDMISPKGTPLVAVVNGEARFSQNNLGGNAVNLVGDNGTRYYYAHLSAYEGSSRRVTAGEIIGYVGSTGNTSVDHLHFEVRPGGGAAVNPTPYVRNAGC